MEETEQATMVQAYWTGGTPDENGNYYVPILVPSDATVGLPITRVEPDPELGGKSLKFDWPTNKWQVSDKDPTLIKMASMQSTIDDLEQDNADMSYAIMTGSTN